MVWSEYDMLGCQIIKTTLSVPAGVTQVRVCSMVGVQGAAELQALVVLPNLAELVPVQLWQQVRLPNSGSGSGAAWQACWKQGIRLGRKMGSDSEFGLFSRLQ